MKYTRDEIRKALCLYAVTDRTWLREGETLIQVCREVLEHGVTFLQLREKELNEEKVLEEACQLKQLCDEYRIPFVVNDNVEIALKADADGVHVGQSDIQGRDIRALLGPDKILGMTARTVEEAVAAEKAGADYIGSGAVFGSSTKKNAKTLPMETLRDICRAVTIPVVAIGGIDEKNIMELSGSGVDGAAIVSGIFAAEEPKKAAGKLRGMSEIMIQQREEHR